MEMLNITSIAEALITLVIAIVGVVYAYLKNKSNKRLNQLDRWVQIAVAAAEQAYKSMPPKTASSMRWTFWQSKA